MIITSCSVSFGRRARSLPFLLLGLAGLGISWLALGAPRADEPTTKPAPSDNASAPIAVVELFTSEGCSSCPPADDVASALAEQAMSGLFVVAFHVDYWDYIGWKDRFATPQATQRQREYSRDKHLDSIYTPQMIVNGKAQFVGSNRAKAEREIKLALEVNATSSVTIVADRDADSVSIRPTISNPPANARIVAAIVQDNLISKPARGENAGKTLHHNRVVRAFSSIDWNPAAPASFDLAIPVDAREAELDAIVWIENADNRHITGASATPVPQPAAPAPTSDMPPTPVNQQPASPR